MIECVFIEPLGLTRRYLRRYADNSNTACPNSWHDARVLLDEVPTLDTEVIGDLWDHNDTRWPTKCSHCDYEFSPTEEWQLFLEKLYASNDRKLITTLRDAPVGAMYYADWLSENRRGPDGHRLMVRTPGGWWDVDSRASNCTKPHDHEHRCWVRHGIPPKVTVDKNGNTCAAGAGSILVGKYHGFLRDGYLT